MRFILSLLLVGMMSQLGTAQMDAKSPVSWSFETKKISKDEFQLIFTAEVDDKWQIYSQHTGEDGPIPTSFAFNEAKGLELVGAVEESGDKSEGYDDMFGTNVIKFKGKTVFTQKVKVKKNLNEVAGTLRFMTCDGSTCLPPKDVPFSFVLQ